MSAPVSVVLGGAGFLGSHLSEALLHAGHTVRVFDRERADLRNLAGCLDGIEFRGGDFLDESDQAAAVLGADYVFHLVSSTIPASSVRNPVYDLETNLVPTVRLLEAVAAGKSQVIYLSSGGTVYGEPQQLPIPEDHPTRPLVPYGMVKLAVERYLDFHHRRHGLSYRVLRLANPYGPRQDPAGRQGAASAFLRAALRDEGVEIWGRGEVVRDYLHVTDAVQGIVAAALRGAPDGVYNLGSGRGTTVSELLDTVRRVTGRALPVTHTAGRAFDLPANVLDITRARQELGWIPTIDLEDGLARTWQTLQESEA